MAPQRRSLSTIRRPACGKPRNGASQIAQGKGKKAEELIQGGSKIRGSNGEKSESGNEWGASKACRDEGGRVDKVRNGSFENTVRLRKCRKLSWTKSAAYARRR
eukprot:349737-Pleurochrysis_carterae.AAC.1